jgi:hypothetical protein
MNREKLILVFKKHAKNTIELHDSIQAPVMTCSNFIDAYNEIIGIKKAEEKISLITAMENVQSVFTKQGKLSAIKYLSEAGVSMKEAYHYVSKNCR